MKKCKRKLQGPQESSSQSSRVLQSVLKSPPVSPQESSSQSSRVLQSVLKSLPVNPKVENIEEEKESYLEQLDY